MTIGERIKKLRKELKLTQQEFASNINLKPTAVLMYEKGSRNVTEQSIALICRTFSVNEEWLRYGKGEMFIPKDDADLLNDASLSEVDKIILRAYISAPKDVRAVIANLIVEAAEKITKAKTPAPVASAQEEPEEVTAENLTAEEKAAIKKMRIEKNTFNVNGGTINF